MTNAETTARLEAKLDKLLAQMERLEARQRSVDQLLEVAVPIAKVALDGAVETFGTWEKAGWFTMGRELARVADRIVRSYTAEDVQRLGDQVVGIVDTMRNLTQPDVLALVNDVAGAVHEADDADPKGMWGLMRASKDADVRKGFGVMVGILKQVGRAADKIGKTQVEAPPVRLPAYETAEGTPRKWVRHLAPTRRVAQVESLPRPAAPRPVVPQGAACSTATPRKPAFAGNPTLPPGYGLDGFATDPDAWTRESGAALAELMSLSLTDAHWAVLDWARSEFMETHASPNIRRLAQGTGVSVRDLYALFPGKPGVLVAMIAGIPKPGGCL